MILFESYFLTYLHPKKSLKQINKLQSTNLLKKKEIKTWPTNCIIMDLYMFEITFQTFTNFKLYICSLSDFARN